MNEFMKNYARVVQNINKIDNSPLNISIDLELIKRYFLKEIVLLNDKFNSVTKTYGAWRYRDYKNKSIEYIPENDVERHRDADKLASFLSGSVKYPRGLTRYRHILPELPYVWGILSINGDIR